MDYNLAALKLLCSQLKSARQAAADPQSAYTLGGILFQRAWLQGILVQSLSSSSSSASASASDFTRFLLDDGTGVIELLVSRDFKNRQWETGMYVMVVGGYFSRAGDRPLIKVILSFAMKYPHHILDGRDSKLMVHKMVDLSAFPDREAMWYLEVVEAFKLFYQPLLEE